MIRTGLARVRGALSMANQPDMFHMSIILTTLPSSNQVIAVSANLGIIRGKVIACHCKPAACHGDVLATYLNSQDDGL